MTKSRKISRRREKVRVAVSGGFDPLHIGHIRMFREAGSLGDHLTVILNNDNWLKKKKGFVFMPENERSELIKSIIGVNDVVISSHPKNPKNMSVSKELLSIKPDIFANGGDRHAHNTPESSACIKIGCKIVYEVGRGGKIQSSSWLIERALTDATASARVKNYINLNSRSDSKKGIK